MADAPTISKSDAVELLELRIKEIDELASKAAAARDDSKEPGVNDPFSHQCGLLDDDIRRTLGSVFGAKTSDFNFYAARIPKLRQVYCQYVASGGWRQVINSEKSYPEEHGIVYDNIYEEREKSLKDFWQDFIIHTRTVLFHAIKRRRETVDTSGATKPMSADANAAEYHRRIFIVHGHDDAAREAVARFLEKIDFEVVILHERANQGRTVIEKFEANSDVGFAIVLLTPDDVGGKAAESLQPRARQNVVLELGYFIGRLGRKRVVALKKGELEFPSDILGVVYETIDDRGAWKQRLSRELEEAGYEIDWNKAMR
jgi:predicted nucleotide-binding protein